MRPGADRACPVCFCQCSAAAAGLKSRHDRSKARQGKGTNETHWQRGRGMRGGCVWGRLEAGAWEPGGLGVGLGKLGAAVQAPHVRALWACAALLATRSCAESRVQSPAPESPVQSSAVQCSSTLLCRACSVSLSMGGGVCSDARAQCQWLDWRTGDLVNDPRQGSSGARGQGFGRSGREGKPKGLPGTARSTDVPSGLPDQTGQGAAAELQVEVAAGVTSSSGRHALGKTGCSTSVARRSSRVPSPPKNQEHFACFACLLPKLGCACPCRAVPRKLARARIPYHVQLYHPVHIVFPNSPSRDGGMKSPTLPAPPGVPSSPP